MNRETILQNLFEYCQKKGLHFCTCSLNGTPGFIEYYDKDKEDVYATFSDFEHYESFEEIRNIGYELYFIKVATNLLKDNC